MECDRVADSNRRNGQDHPRLEPRTNPAQKPNRAQGTYTWRREGALQSSQRVRIGKLFQRWHCTVLGHKKQDMHDKVRSRRRCFHIGMECRWGCTGCWAEGTYCAMY